MKGPAVAAVDLGASSGRVIRGSVDGGRLALTEVARFPNDPVQVGGTLHWDVLALYRSVLDGLSAAGEVDSVGVDSWAIDYGLLDADGRLLGNPVHYRDARTEGVPERVLAEIPAAELYGRTGLQILPFNTVFQLVAGRDTAQARTARTMLLMPDLLTYWMTGTMAAELTNASTTGLLDARTAAWDTDLMTRLGLDPGLLPPLREPGTPAGPMLPEVAAIVGGPAAVTSVASHDTASAVLAVPAESKRFAYISCGTWSLVGVELDGPVLTEDSRAANFTNERGIDGTVRYLRNVIGLWPLQECLRAWRDVYLDDLDELLAAAAALPSGAVVDLDRPEFVAPGNMPARIADACRAAGQPAPADPPAIVRCVLDSLAAAHRKAVDDAERLSGTTADVIHMVGGGAQNQLLCQLTADACGRTVIAGPVEATAIGNILVQARALGGRVAASLPEMRDLVRRSVVTRTYHPGQ